MSPLQDFEAALNEVVQAKRLSQSKMTKLTELAMKHMDQDTQLVSTMYRTHKALPASCKISSLYVFDALARAARQQVIKHNLSERHATGNCATFLSKVAGVLEGLFQDILATGLPEAKEKTKKIYDIWVKGNTFSPNILSRLSDVVLGNNKVFSSLAERTALNQRLVCSTLESEVNHSVTTDPRVTSQTNSTVSIPSPVVSTPTDTQATLLALLTQAASHRIPQTNANTTPAPPAMPLDSAQLAILQYLQSASVNTAVAGQTSPTTPAPAPVSDTHVSQTATDPRMSKSPSALHAEANYARQNKKLDNYRSPPRNDRYHERDYDDRGYSRNNPRGGLRRRGRWNRWDEREPTSYRDHNGRGWSPRSGGRSRSHSPSGRADRKLSPPTSSSPQRQPFSSQSRYRGDNSTSYTTNRNSGRDEFGRDLRSSSPSRSPTSGPVSNQPTNTSPVTPSASHDPKAELSSTSTSNDPMSRSSSIAANTFSKDPDASITSLESSNKTTPQTGLENFDMSTFDPTSPASWEGLGKMWEVTNGYSPSTEELMQFMVMGAMSQSVTSKNWSQQGGMGPSGSSGHSNDHNRGSFSRGRGGYGGHYGNSRNINHGWTNGSDGGSTDAVVLGGGETDSDVSVAGDDMQQEQIASPGLRSGGKMQKVGDKWVFVRNDGAT